MDTDKRKLMRQGQAKIKPQLGVVNESTTDQQHDYSAAILDIVSRILNQENFSAVAINLVNELAFHLQCDRVCLGIRDGQHAKVFAMSNSASFDHKSNLIRSIGLAMDEAIDERTVLSLPNLDETASTLTVAHEQLSQLQGERSILSIPLFANSKPLGSLCLERDKDRPFSDEEIQFCDQLTGLIAPGLSLFYRDSLPVPKKFIAACRDFFGGILGPAHLKTKVSGAILLLAVSYMTFVSGEYRVTANAVIQGSTLRVISAPIDGYIATAERRAGDVVKKGSLIATMDDRDLRLQAIKWQSQKQQLRREYRESLAQNDRTKISILSSKIKQADAQLELVNEQTERLKIIAPFDGVILEGDLDQMVGSPVSRGDALFKIAPQNSYKTILEVDESEISQITVDQTGLLSLSSIPDQNFPITVSRITPVSVAQDGRNYFRVEATMQQGGGVIQPGMEGVAKVTIGDRRILWIYAHKIKDRLDLLLWNIIP